MQVKQANRKVTSNNCQTFFHMSLEQRNKVYCNRTHIHFIYSDRCYCGHLVACTYISQWTPDLRIQVLCHAILCRSVSGSQNFKGMNCLHLQWSQRPSRMFNSWHGKAQIQWDSITSQKNWILLRYTTVETTYQFLEQNLTSTGCLQDECLYHVLIFTPLHKFNDKYSGSLKQILWMIYSTERTRSHYTPTEPTMWISIRVPCAAYSAPWNVLCAYADNIATHHLQISQYITTHSAHTNPHIHMVSLYSDFLPIL